ncbi:uncharacterized protein LOC108864273 [Galendromus occidentalis]|uniref:Uncharacterized protein LOC108864273 n=1 Tax=Galendromus occidentalis TaxID=34638 RepID=A0AAJ7P9R9_9ACAR|nr:uncharacterized protein LOC108864273 [Galendromus occidentalis]
MSSKRKGYSVAFKRAIVEQSRGGNLKKFCEEMKLDLRMVRKWRAGYHDLVRLTHDGSADRRKCGTGRQPYYLELEDAIYDWILDRRALSLVVNRAEVQAFALASAPRFDISTEDVKASSHWLAAFMKRKELSLRRSTTLFKLEDDQVIERALAFKSFIDKIDSSRYEAWNVIAMDETAVFLGPGP